MSVAELTINYVSKSCLAGRQAGFGVFDRVKEADFSVSLHKRKTILRAFAVAFVLFVSLYLYLAGNIVAMGIRTNDLKERLNYALILSSERESELIKSAYSKNSDFFASEGYEKPLSIEVIKRSLNVVEISQARPLY